MTETAEQTRLANLEPLGDATQYATQIHGMIAYSPLFENFNLAEIRLLSHFMQAYRAEPGVEIIREGEPGDFMMMLIEVWKSSTISCTLIVRAPARREDEGGGERRALRR